MTDTPDELVSEPSPTELRDPLQRIELRRATVWFALAGAVALVVLLIQPILIIFAGIVFAAMLDGGVRVLGKVLPIGRGWRLLIVVLAVIAFLIGTIYLTGVQAVQQFAQLKATVVQQSDRITGWLSSMGIIPQGANLQSLAKEAAGQASKLTSYVGTALGAVTTMVFILVLGLFFAM